MAKNITRTITVHTYTTAKVNTAECKIENVQHFSFPYKLNEKQKRSLVAQTGNPIVSEDVGEALYAMSIEDFVKYAKPIDATDGEDNG